MTASEERRQSLLDALESRILVIDGAMGTMLQQQHLTAADFGGPQLEGCNEILVKTRPEVVLGIHRAYLEAGADIIETNSFNGTKSDLVDYGVDGEAYELMAAAARLARQAADEFSTARKPRFVAGSMGPTTQEHHHQPDDHLRSSPAGLLRSGQALGRRRRRYSALETCQDTRNIKAGLLADRSA